jgi:hypothetical protein
MTARALMFFAFFLTLGSFQNLRAQLIKTGAEVARQRQEKEDQFKEEITNYKNNLSKKTPWELSLGQKQAMVMTASCLGAAVTPIVGIAESLPLGLGAPATLIAMLISPYTALDEISFNEGLGFMRFLEGKFRGGFTISVASEPSETDLLRTTYLGSEIVYQETIAGNYDCRRALAKLQLSLFETYQRKKTADNLFATRVAKPFNRVKDWIRPSNSRGSR